LEELVVLEKKRDVQIIMQEFFDKHNSWNFNQWSDVHYAINRL
jgi:hypothetical protein